MKQVLLRTKGAQPALALLEERRLVEYWALNEDLAFGAGAVYVGRAGRVMKGLNALFVSLAPGVEGFLPFDELVGPRPAPGDSLLVQIKKPPQGGKAAYLSQDLALPGRLAMLLPFSKHAHASKRVADRKGLKQLAQRLCPADMGLVLRVHAQQASLPQIQAEIDSLLTAWRKLEHLAAQASAPALLQAAPGPLERLLRDEEPLPQLVLADDEKALASLPLPGRVAEDPFGLFGIEQQLKVALGRRVYLPSGGCLVLDPCEAALVIDVNTAQDSGKAGNLALRTNVEAAREIARLLRLRRTGGIILIDFIDMADQAQRDQVQKALEEALQADRITSEVLGFTRLGLVEMTRKRAELPLAAPHTQTREKEDEDA